MKNFPQSNYNISHNDVLYTLIKDDVSFQDDLSFFNHNIVNNGDVQYVSGLGMYFSSVSKYLDINTPNDIVLYDNDFTISMCVFFSSVSNVCLLDICDDINKRFSFRINEGSNGLYCYLGNIKYGASYTFNSGMMYHVCWTRKYNTLFAFVNGQKIFEQKLNPVFTIGYGKVRIGYILTGTVSGVSNFYLNNVRITNNICRYITDFEPIFNNIKINNIVNINSCKNTNDNLDLIIDQSYSSNNRKPIIENDIKLLPHQTLNIDLESYSSLLETDFEISFIMYVLEGMDKIILSNSGIYTPWGLKYSNGKLEWKTSNGQIFSSNVELRKGWNNIVITRKDNIFCFYINSVRDEEYYDDSNYSNIDQLVIGNPVGYDREILYKRLSKTEKKYSIYNFTIPSNWKFSNIYFKITVLNDLKLSGDFVIKSQIFRTNIDEQYVNYDNLINSNATYCSFISTEIVKSFILKSFIYELDNDSNNTIYTIVINREIDNPEDNFQDDIKILSIRAVLMPDTTEKTEDPNIFYYDIVDKNISTQIYNIDLSTDSFSKLNTGIKNIEYTLPLPDQNKKQINIYAPIGRDCIVHASTLGDYKNNINAISFLQFFSYHNKWYILVNKNFTKI